MKKKVKASLVIASASAAAAAGYYFYASKKAKKHREIVTKWATDMKGEVLKKTKHLKNVNPESIAKIVDAVAGTYEGIRSIKLADLENAAQELKSNWKTLQKEAQKSAKKTVKKVVKKVKTEGRKS